MRVQQLDVVDVLVPAEVERHAPPLVGVVIRAGQHHVRVRIMPPRFALVGRCAVMHHIRHFHARIDAPRLEEILDRPFGQIADKLLALVMWNHLDQRPDLG